MSVYFRGNTDLGGNTYEIGGNVEIDPANTDEIAALLDILGLIDGYVEFCGQVLVNRDKNGETQQYRYINAETQVHRDRSGLTWTYDENCNKVVLDPQIIRGTVVYRDNNGQVRVITA